MVHVAGGNAEGTAAADLVPLGMATDAERKRRIDCLQEVRDAALARCLADGISREDLHAATAAAVDAEAELVDIGGSPPLGEDYSDRDSGGE